jgi:SH3-like domain-containing protein
MFVVGVDRQAEGRTWKNVSDPAGNVGWVPAEYLITSVVSPTPRPVMRLGTPTPTLRTAPPQPAIAPTAVRRNCCKICTKGKACGDSCINRNYTCRQPPGCACDG